jgi:hypothetical protein
VEAAGVGSRSCVENKQLVYFKGRTIEQKTQESGILHTPDTHELLWLGGLNDPVGQ